MLHLSPVDADHSESPEGEEPLRSPEYVGEMAAIDEHERCGELPDRTSATIFPGRPGEGATVLITVQIPTDVIDGERWNALVTRDRCAWKYVVANLSGEGMREVHSPRGLRLFIDRGISDQCAIQLSTWNESEVYRWKGDELVPTMHTTKRVGGHE